MIMPACAARPGTFLDSTPGPAGRRDVRCVWRLPSNWYGPFATLACLLVKLAHDGLSDRSPCEELISRGPRAETSFTRMPHLAKGQVSRSCPPSHLRAHRQLSPSSSPQSWPCPGLPPKSSSLTDERPSTSIPRSQLTMRRTPRNFHLLGWRRLEHFVLPQPPRSASPHSLCGRRHTLSPPPILADHGSPSAGCFQGGPFPGKTR